MLVCHRNTSNTLLQAGKYVRRPACTGYVPRQESARHTWGNTPSPTQARNTSYQSTQGLSSFPNLARPCIITMQHRAYLGRKVMITCTTLAYCQHVLERRHRNLAPPLPIAAHSDNRTITVSTHGMQSHVFANFATAAWQVAKISNGPCKTYKVVHTS